MSYREEWTVRSKATLEAMYVMIETATEWDFLTPAGKRAHFYVRANTSDWNTVNACTEVGNEYGLPAGQSGWAMDIGAHIGAVAVSYLIDNPDAKVVAIEALPENVQYLRRNLEVNGVADRCYVFEGAAASEPGFTWIGYGEVRDPTGIHKYIGNANAPEGSSGVDALNITLVQVCEGLEIEEIEWAKLDCEGCEYAFLVSPFLDRIATIVGEVHFGAQRLIDIVSATHNIQADKDFGPFWAYRK